MGFSDSAAPAVVDALAWVYVRDGRVLKVRPRGKEVFYFPGGKREPGESDAEALVREVAEEVSVRLAHEGRSMTSKASDPDTLVASAKAYLGALNKIVMKRQRDMPAAAAS